MSSNDFLSPTVSDVQRDRAVEFLQESYAAGTLSQHDFEMRLATALTAANRTELNSSLRGLARISPRPATHLPTSATAVGGSQTGPGLVHLSGFMFGFLGPLITKAIATPGTRTWWEASRALAFQLSALLGGIVLATLGAIFGLDWPFVLAGLVWMGGTALLAARAFNGRNSTKGLEWAMIVKPPQERPQLGR